MYEQNLYHTVEDHIKPKVLNRMNRLKNGNTDTIKTMI